MNRLQESFIRLLRWSEKYTKTDMVYLASGSFWSTVGQFSVSVCALALSVVLSRYLTQTGYGDYRYVLSIVALLGTFSLSGLTTSVFQSTARGFDAALPEGFWMNLRWSILVFAGALGIGSYYLFHGNMVLGVGMLVGGCLSPLLSSAMLFSQFLAAKKDFAKQTIYVAIWGTILPTAALICTAILTKNPLWVTAVYFIGNALAMLYFYYRTLRVYRVDKSLQDKELLSYSKHMSFINILSSIAGNVDNILVFHFVGAPALAVYSFATGIVDQSKGPLKSLDNMMQAQFVKRNPGDARGGMANKMWLLFFFSLICIAVYIPLAPFIYKLLFPTYVSAIPYSQVYALSLLMMVFWPASSYIQAKKMLKEQYVSNAVGSVAQIAILAWGVIGWGLWGLVIARVITRVGGNAFSYYLYARSDKRL